MSNNSDNSGCGCLVMIILVIGFIVSSIKGCHDESKSRDLKPDYSSTASEEGRFEHGVGTLSVRDFRVADGIAYLTLDTGVVVKMWRNGYGEYEGRYDGRTYTAKKKENGYEVRRRR